MLFKAKIFATLSAFLIVSSSALADDVDLTLTLSDNSTAKVEIVDDLGPLNSWKDVSGKFGLNGSATFTNSSHVGNARGCGATACWIANNFDIDDVSVGDEGTGKVNFTLEMDGIGDMKWKVTRVE